MISACQVLLVMWVDSIKSITGALYHVKRKYQNSNKCQFGVTGITGDLGRKLEIYKMIHRVHCNL